MNTTRRAGVTLIELMVTLVVLGIVLGVVAIAPPRLMATQPAQSIAMRIKTLRQSAISERRPKTIVIADSLKSSLVTALPDGEVLGDVKELDRLAGEVAHDETSHDAR